MYSVQVGSVLHRISLGLLPSWKGYEKKERKTEKKKKKGGGGGEGKMKRKKEKEKEESRCQGFDVSSVLAFLKLWVWRCLFLL